MITLLLAQALHASIVAGAISSMGSQDSYSLSPTATIEVHALIVEDVDYSPQLRVKVDLSSLPGESFDLKDSASFKSLEFEAGLGQSIPKTSAKIYAGFGLANRLPGDDAPRVNVAKYFTAGIRFSTGDSESYLYVGGGPDQRLERNGFYSGCGHIEGKLKLPIKYKDVNMYLKGNAILGGVSSLVRVGIVVGI